MPAPREWSSSDPRWRNLVERLEAELATIPRGPIRPADERPLYPLCAAAPDVDLGETDHDVVHVVSGGSPVCIRCGTTVFGPGDAS